jgi:pyridoxamine 5'-phosphate oxidase
MELRTRFRSWFILGRGLLRGLSEEAAGPDPIALFGEWFEAAQRAGLILPEAMSVATATADGVPSARMMLLKDYGEEGFVFYTNYESRKGTELTGNPRAALLFWWPPLQRQIRIEGTVERISEEDSARYFQTRPRGSRLCAWASAQSSVVDDRNHLEQSFRKQQALFKGSEVSLPPFWGGLRLIPQRIEFWQGRLNRLHDRLLYTRETAGWKRVRLAP